MSTKALNPDKKGMKAITIKKQKTSPSGKTKTSKTYPKKPFSRNWLP